MKFLISLLLLCSLFCCTAQELTIPPKNYTDSIDLSAKPKRTNNRFPLSDQNNHVGWKMNKDFTDEFDSKKLNTERWHPNNPGWKGRKPTYFHGSNVNMDGGELVFKINQHGDESLPEGYTHSAGFIKTKERILYGYFEAELKLMDAPWVSGFWLTYGDKEWWTEIDICENDPGVARNRNDLNSNVHVFRAPPEKGDVKKHFSITKRFFFPEELQKDYHVWGLEWN
ncbi:MAG: family 16 glycosylhydrolase, partial [Bacteroidota bacterium]